MLFIIQHSALPETKPAFDNFQGCLVVLELHDQAKDIQDLRPTLLSSEDSWPNPVDPWTQGWPRGCHQAWVLPVRNVQGWICEPAANVHKYFLSRIQGWKWEESQMIGWAFPMEADQPYLKHEVHKEVSGKVKQWLMRINRKYRGWGQTRR